MNLEIISFRAALSVALLSLLLCGGFTIYSYAQAKIWEEAIGHNYDQLSACRGMENESACAMPVEQLEENYDRSVINRILYSQRAVLSGHLTWLLPLLSMSVFYSLRWLVSGRVRPFWPGSSPSDRTEGM